MRCTHCGKTNHDANRCYFKRAKCRNCGKQGHIAKICRAAPKGRLMDLPQGRSSIKTVQQEEVRDEPLDAENEYLLFKFEDKKKSYTIIVDIDGRSVSMEIDTGASISIMSQESYKELWPDRDLKESKAKLRTYSGEYLKVLGEIETRVSHSNNHAKLPLVIVQGRGPTLLGRDWLSRLLLDWSQVNAISKEPTLQSILDQYEVVFKEGLGTLKNFTAKIYVDPTLKPRFFKARPVPYALRSQIESELDRLVEKGITTPISFSEWAAPIVPVMKNDKTIRICGDFRVTINQASKLDQYPIPKVEDLFSQLSGGKTFTKLDMSQAYQQLLLDEDSQNFVVVNTHKGLFKYKHLPFGVSSAPGIFQRVMDTERYSPCHSLLGWHTNYRSLSARAFTDSRTSVVKAKRGWSMLKQKEVFVFANHQ